MSWFSSAPAPTGPNFKPVATTGELLGPLTDNDTDWACESNKGFRTETQSWYSILADGSWTMYQIIYSVTGIMLVPAQINFVFKHYDPKTKEVIWKSVPLTKFKAQGKNVTSDQVNIKHTGTSAGEESYSITANLGSDVQLSVQFARPAAVPGFKIGEGADGGTSFFGHDSSKPDGIVWHKFLPVLISSGSIIINKKVVSADGEAMLSHAVQGMQPNLIARRWNFVFFTSTPPTSDLLSEENVKKRTRAIMMEFETNDEHGIDGKGKGRNRVNVGGIVVDNKLTLVTSQVHVAAPSEGEHKQGLSVSQATHISPVLDDFTGYSPPSRVKFEWAGATAKGDNVKAWTEYATGNGAVGDGGLIEKVDVLGEIPYLIKKVVQVVASTKPYIYQHYTDAQLHITLPGASEETSIDGKVFDELTFIS